MSDTLSNSPNYGLDPDATRSTGEINGSYKRSMNGLDFQTTGPVIGESNNSYKKYAPLAFSKKNTETGKFAPYSLKVSGETCMIPFVNARRIDAPPGVERVKISGANKNWNCCPKTVEMEMATQMSVFKEEVGKVCFEYMASGSASHVYENKKFGWILKIEEIHGSSNYDDPWANFYRSRLANANDTAMVPHHFTHCAKDAKIKSPATENGAYFSLTRKIDWVLSDLLEKEIPRQMYVTTEPNQDIIMKTIVIASIAMMGYTQFTMRNWGNVIPGDVKLDNMGIDCHGVWMIDLGGMIYRETDRGHWDTLSKRLAKNVTLIKNSFTTILEKRAMDQQRCFANFFPSFRPWKVRGQKPFRKEISKTRI